MRQQPMIQPRDWTAAEKELMKDQFERWKWLGPILDGIRFRELRAMTDEDRVRALTSVMACPIPRQCNDKSGWIAWQKVRKQWMKKPKES